MNSHLADVETEEHVALVGFSCLGDDDARIETPLRRLEQVARGVMIGVDDDMFEGFVERIENQIGAIRIEDHARLVECLAGRHELGLRVGEFLD